MFFQRCMCQSILTFRWIETDRKHSSSTSHVKLTCHRQEIKCIQGTYGRSPAERQKTQRVDPNNGDDRWGQWPVKTSLNSAIKDEPGLQKLSSPLPEALTALISVQQVPAFLSEFINWLLFLNPTKGFELTWTDLVTWWVWMAERGTYESVTNSCNKI